MIKRISVVALLLVFGQLINAAGSPVITRLYTPESIGSFSVYLAALYIFCSFSSFRFDKKILTGKSQRVRTSFFILGALFSTVFSILIFFATSLVFITTSIIEPSKYNLIVTLVLTIPIYVTFQCYLNILVAKNRARLAASVRLAQILLMLLFQVALGYFSSLDNSLELGYLLSFLISILIGVFCTDLGRNISFEKLKILTILNFRQNFFGASSNLLNVMSTQLVTLLLASFFSETEVGFYAIAFRVLIAPSGVFSQAIVQSLSVNIRNWVAANQNSKVRKFIRYNALGSFVIFGCLFISVFSIGTSGFSFIFGAKWADVYYYSLAIFPWLFTSAIISPSSILFIFYRAESKNLLLQMFSLLGKIVTIFISQFFFSALTTVLVVSIVTGVINLCGVLFLYKLSKRVELKSYG